MTAAPFKGLLVLRPLAGGSSISLRFSFTDVALAFGTLDDYNAIAQLVVPSGGYVVEDFTLGASGTDTTAIQVRKGTQDTTVILRNAQLANLTTDVQTRLQGFRGARLEPGATYFFRSLA